MRHLHLATLAGLLLVACGTPVPPPGTVIPGSVAGTTAPQPVVRVDPTAVATVPGTARTLPRPSTAGTPREYRRDAAAHIYELNRVRVWQGRLPAMLYAVGVLEVDLDARGNILRFNWRRAPRHAPEVIAEIERTVRAAAPFPAPLRMGRVTWTDVWLWHESGRFQLDTLTEGQD